MKFGQNFLTRYLALAPAALAIERVLECRILETQKFARPILDLGCGDGIFASVLFAEKIDLGIDLDPVEIERSRRLGAYDELLASPASVVPKPAESFATIFSNSVLEHIPDLAPVLAEVLRLLRPGGRFYVTVPTDNFEVYSTIGRILQSVGTHKALERYRAVYNRFWQHYNVHDDAGWRRLFEAAGFEVVETRSYDSRNMCTLNDMLTPLAGVSLISKKLLRRWMLFPVLRGAIAPLLGSAIEPLIDRLESGKEGGLLFLSLRKP
jgi:SAM-dependent methyltransferase